MCAHMFERVQAELPSGDRLAILLVGRVLLTTRAFEFMASVVHTEEHYPFVFLLSQGIL